MGQLSAPTPDATTASKGKVQLANNLGGTAALPTVVGVQQGAVGGAGLSTSAITLGYTQITANFSTTSTTAVQITGLTSTVTVPAGGRRVKITVYCRDVYNSGTTPMGAFLSIWDGTVGSGTQLQEYSMAQNTTSGLASVGIMMAVVTPSAGSKTYNVGMRTQTAGGTSNLESGATYPAFILVEAI